MDEKDIWRAAQACINSHGDGAEAFAEKRFAELYDQRDIVGAATWEHVIAKIREIQNTEPNSVH